MSNNRDCSTTTIYNKGGPDFFGFYPSEVAQLLSKDEGHVPISHSTSHLVVNINEENEKTIGLTKGSKTNEHNCINGFAPYSNGIGALLADSQKERLKSLLRQSVFTLTKEVDEMIDPILSLCRIQSCLECKEELLNDQSQPSQKRLKRDCSNQQKNGPVMNSDAKDDQECVEIDADLRYLLESDPIKVEELLKNQSNEFLATLHHMKQNLEELLNISMTSCRPMTISEKLQLRKLIQSLPPKNLDRVVEMIRNGEKVPEDEVHVDLDRMENATLWRLYYYVATVQGIAA